MSCFGMATTSSSSRRGRPKPWRWWRKCAGLAVAVHSKLRRRSGRAVRWSVPGLGVDSRRRRTPQSSSLQRGWCHLRSFPPIYVDELYNQPKSLSVVQEHALQEEPSTSGSKLARVVDAAAGTARVSARASGSKARVGDNTSITSVGARASGSKARVDATPSKSDGVRRSVLPMSPSRGGGGVLGVVKGMGEVDLRAELFIRKFREEMRLQSQKSAEEFQAMLARGL